MNDNDIVALPDSGDLAFLSLADAAERLRKRAVSSAALTETCLSRIARFDPVLNAFVTVTAEVAREQAARCDVEIDRGEWRGPLHGIPIAVKDNIDVAGVPTTAA